MVKDAGIYRYGVLKSVPCVDGEPCVGQVEHAATGQNFVGDRRKGMLTELSRQGF